MEVTKVFEGIETFPLSSSSNLLKKSASGHEMSFLNKTSSSKRTSVLEPAKQPSRGSTGIWPKKEPSRSISIVEPTRTISIKESKKQLSRKISATEPRRQHSRSISIVEPTKPALSHLPPKKRPSKLVADDDRLSPKTSTDELLVLRATAYKRPLFKTVKGQVADVPVETVIVSGIGLRSLTSLQAALYEEQQKVLLEIYRQQQKRQSATVSTLPKSTSTTSSIYSMPSHPSLLQTSSSTAAAVTQTEGIIQEMNRQRRIRYLMGLPEDEEEEGSSGQYPVVETEEGEAYTTESMRYAQKYLRVHRIFELFQFIIAHILSALPDNPIEFIFDLLESCLTFRAGLEQPPLLFGPKHLECLFHLMDRMDTGYIDIKQYETGLHTVGVRPPYKYPRITKYGLITKEDFIAEAFSSLSDILGDLLRTRIMGPPQPDVCRPPPTPPFSLSSGSRDSLDANVGNKTTLFLKCHTEPRRQPKQF